MENKPVVESEPRILEATGDNGKLLLTSDYYNREHVTAEVPQYEGMATGQTVGVRWRGPAVPPYDSPIRIVPFPAILTFDIPRYEVLDAIGSAVVVTFTVQRGAQQPIEWSLPLNLRVQGTALPAPTIAVSGTTATVTVTYPSQATGQRVHVRWQGTVVHDTEQQSVTPGTPNVFHIPPAWVSQNSGKMVYINYAVGTTSGDPYLFSRTLRKQL
ncbi:hypothetical protein [Pandoraea sp. NPDC087047]|uniref:hypothetical protein n=1 Tax=Pandoraea sp. NPDC087047 TaxID=3364390 RepID=UPI00382691B0